MTRSRCRKSISLAETAATLSKDHSRPVVRAAMLRHWLGRANLSLGLFPADSATGRYLCEATADECSKLKAHWESSQGGSLKDLEGALEALIDAGRRRRQGAVYTPDFIIDYLLEHALVWVSQQSEPGVVCDPACGSGGFLLRAAWHLHRRGEMSLSEALQRHVVGFDNDPEALRSAHCLIELFLAQRHLPLLAEGPRLYWRDTLLASPKELHELAESPHGFSVVATNPPYVKLQNLDPEYRRALVKRYGEYLQGSFSLAPLFLLAGRDMLAEGGIAAFITQNNLFTSLAGRPIRRFLQQQRCLRRIVDFGHERVFANASAYTCLLFVGSAAEDNFQYSQLRRPPSRESLESASFSRIELQGLCEKKWRLAEKKHLDNLLRIETTGVALGKLADIRVGFATLKDRVFLIPWSDGRCLASGPDGQPMEVELELTRPAIKVASLSGQEDLGGAVSRVIFPYFRDGQRWRVIAEDDLRRRFPLGYRYLSSFRDLLGQRDKGNKKYEAWYCWGRSQSRDAPGPKLLTKTFDRRPNFMLDRTDRLFCNGYSVSFSSRKEACGFSIELLQRILNSQVMRYYARLTSFQIEGGYQCYQKNFIERFGVPALSPPQIDRLTSASDQQVETQLRKIYHLSADDVGEILDIE